MSKFSITFPSNCAGKKFEIVERKPLKLRAKFLCSFALIAISTMPAKAESFTIKDVEFKAPRFHIMTLTRCDRDKRSWKTFKLLPGKINNWYYECLTESGSVILKEADSKLPDVRDARPLSDSHPNLAGLLKVVNISAPPMMAGATTLVGVRR